MMSLLLEEVWWEVALPISFLNGITKKRWLAISRLNCKGHPVRCKIGTGCIIKHHLGMQYLVCSVLSCTHFWKGKSVMWNIIGLVALLLFLKKKTRNGRFVWLKNRQKLVSR